MSKLLSEKKLLNVLFKDSPDSIFIIDNKGIIVDCNRAAIKELGYLKKEITGSPITKFLQKESLKVFESKFPGFKKFEKQEGEIQVVNKKGEIIDIWRKGVPVKGENDSFLGLVVFDRDITKRKNAEKALLSNKKNLELEVKRQTNKLIELNKELYSLIKDLQKEREKNLSILKALPDIIFIIDKECRFIDYNVADISQLFVNPEVFLGKRLDEVLPDDIGFEAMNSVRDTFKTNKIQLYEYSLQIKGEEQWFEARIVPKNKNEVLVVTRNITESKNAKKAIVDALEKAEKSDKLKSAFLANMSHEIRTPMNSIIGFSDLLSTVTSDEKRKEFVNLIKKNGSNLLAIINDILDISKIEAGLVTVTKTQFNINEELKYLFDSFSGHPKSLSGLIKLKLTLGLNDKNAVINTDRTKFIQIMTNLINNAMKFTNEGFVEFGYSIHLKKGTPVVKFFVKDSGIGISRNDVDIIFDRFRQADIDDTSALGGTGLGLAICKGFVDVLGGTIGVDSEKGKGSFFYFTLPFIKSSDAENTEVEFFPLKDVNWSDKTILIVEDNVSNYKLLEAYLSFTDAFVLRAANGKMAVKMCKKIDNIDLVLMDIKMPEMNGIEATKEIRKIRKSLPVIAQTAYAMDSDKEECLNAGCDAYFEKPISRNKFISVLSKFLD